jgi:hypothetical protein
MFEVLRDLRLRLRTLPENRPAMMAALMINVTDRRDESRSRRRAVESPGPYEAAQSVEAARGVPDGASHVTG